MSPNQLPKKIFLLQQHDAWGKTHPIVMIFHSFYVFRTWRSICNVWKSCDLNNHFPMDWVVSPIRLLKNHFFCSNRRWGKTIQFSWFFIHLRIWPPKSM